MLLIKLLSQSYSPKLAVKIVDEDSKLAAGGLKVHVKDEVGSSDVVRVLLINFFRQVVLIIVTLPHGAHS